MVPPGILKIPGHRTWPFTLVITILTFNILVWKMPAFNAITTTLRGVAFAVWQMFEELARVLGSVEDASRPPIEDEM